MPWLRALAFLTPNLLFWFHPVHLISSLVWPACDRIRSLFRTFYTADLFHDYFLLGSYCPPEDHMQPISRHFMSLGRKWLRRLWLFDVDINRLPLGKLNDLICALQHVLSQCKTKSSLWSTLILQEKASCNLQPELHPFMPLYFTCHGRSFCLIVGWCYQIWSTDSGFISKWGEGHNANFSSPPLSGISFGSETVLLCLREF